MCRAVSISPTYSVCPDHGYITGEVASCPYCGKNTEVYSRITGYYRPVQNWNDGKAQEYKQRKEYNVASLVSDEIKAEDKPETINEECESCGIDTFDQTVLSDEKVGEVQINTKFVLFATPTCPNCKIACAMLDKAGLSYEKIYATEYPEMATEYGIQQAPTLVVVDGSEPKSTPRYRGAGQIKSFIDSLK